MANITVGVFQLPLIAIYTQVNGVVKPKLHVLSELTNIMQNHLKVRVKFKIAQKGQLGLWTQNGYKDGVLGLLSNGEIDFCFYPTPYEIKEPPGLFAGPVAEEDYVVTTIHQTTKHTVHTLASSLSEINPKIWLTFLLITYIFEMIILNIEKRRESFWITPMVAMKRVNELLFGQIFGHRSFFRLIQIFGIMMFGLIFSASFNTSAIVKENIQKIDSLQDIIEANKIPIFFEGESNIDSFKFGLTKDTRQVFKMARAFGTDKTLSTGFGFLGKKFDYSSMPKKAYLISKRFNSVWQAAAKFTQLNFGTFYTSNQPIQRSMLAYIYSKEDHLKKYRRSIHILASRTFEAGITQYLVGRIPDEIVLNIDFLTITPHELNAIRNDKFEESGLFVPWKIESYYEVIMVCSYATVGAVVCWFIELIFRKMKST